MEIIKGKKYRLLFDKFLPPETKGINCREFIRGRKAVTLR